MWNIKPNIIYNKVGAPIIVWIKHIINPLMISFSVYLYKIFKSKLRLCDIHLHFHGLSIFFYIISSVKLGFMDKQPHSHGKSGLLITSTILTQVEIEPHSHVNCGFSRKNFKVKKKALIL